MQQKLVLLMNGSDPLGDQTRCWVLGQVVGLIEGDAALILLAYNLLDVLMKTPTPKKLKKNKFSRFLLPGILLVVSVPGLELLLMPSLGLFGLLIYDINDLEDGGDPQEIIPHVFSGLHEEMLARPSIKNLSLSGESLLEAMFESFPGLCGIRVVPNIK